MIVSLSFLVDALHLTSVYYFIINLSRRTLNMLMFYILFLFYYFVITYTVDVPVKSSNTRGIRSSKLSIIDSSDCREIKSICHNLVEKDDLLILECLQSVNPDRLNRINKDCQHIIWEHTRSLIQDESVKNKLLTSCSNELDLLSCRVSENGNTYLKCVLDNINSLRSVECIEMITRLESVAFTDYMWISSFLQHCTKDIDNLKCGRLDSHSFSQINTINCLQNKILNVQDDCKREVFHLSELQSENIKFDTQLYSECSDDYIRYCSNYQAGSGRVFSCLMQHMHKDRSKLREKCQQHLLRRQKLMVQDYRVSKGLLRACRDEIKKMHCRRQISSDKTVRLAQILLCLENMTKNDTKMNPDCEAEMIEHRRMLMEDYRLSPEIVNSCKLEISVFCKALETGGKTIHCLMEHALVKARSNNGSAIGIECMRALDDLVKETDAGENWQVDPVLHQACDPVVKVACKKVQGGDARIMSCLMDKIGTEYMNEECENALIQIQYFVARDFQLDPQLYKACNRDATMYCHFKGDSSLEKGPSYGPEVLPCLYRYAYHMDKDMALQKPCLKQIRRVMKLRAISVNLQPEVEEPCLTDLGDLCRDKLKNGEEMECLQNNLERLQPKCREVVESFTEIEAQNTDLNPYIARYCKTVIEELCSAEISNDEGSVMDCLIDNKNNALVKSSHACRASIDHFQLISLKDYRFTYKFKVACKSYATNLCSRSRTKNEVVACLSEHILNATVQGLKSSISKDCKQQLRSQIFHQRESIDLDPSLKVACSSDITKFCANLHSGNSQVLECLQGVTPGQLSGKCEKEVFRVLKTEVYDNSVDYALLTTCAQTIDHFCPEHERQTVLDCLKANKDEKGFDKKCRMIVSHRMMEQNANYLLNPSLQKNCHIDIKKFCRSELLANDKTVSDSVIKCLKIQFKSFKLSETCEKEMAEVLREQALDVNLNPLIKVVCRNEIQTICKFEEEDSGKVEECLKASLLNKNIPTPECRLEVANMIEESQVDIQVDPLLQRTCALDLLTFCNNVPQGNGRHIQCLRKIMERGLQNLTPNCKTKLKERFEMYKNAAQIAPLNDLEDLYQHVVSSPSKNYFVVVVFMLFAGIFVTGMLCGRVTRNKYRLLKNK